MNEQEQSDKANEEKSRNKIYFSTSKKALNNQNSTHIWGWRAKKLVSDPAHRTQHLWDTSGIGWNEKHLKSPFSRATRRQQERHRKKTHKWSRNKREKLETFSLWQPANASLTGLAPSHSPRPGCCVYVDDADDTELRDEMKSIYFLTYTSRNKKRMLFVIQTNFWCCHWDCTHSALTSDPRYRAYI